MIKKARIQDVAKHAGLSTATVSRYINGTAHVSKETAEKIQTSIEALNFTPHMAAQILASQKTRIIGLFLSYLTDSFSAPLLRGIERRALEDDYSLLVHSTEIYVKHNRPFRRILGEHNTDGLLVFPGSIDAKELRRLCNLQFPVVLLHFAPPENLKIPFVTVENKKGVYRLTSHLINLHGHKRIVFLRGPDGHDDGKWREEGYVKALQDHGIPYNPDLIEIGNFNAEDAKAAVKRLLNKKIRFDAIFAGDDESASGAMRALNEAGLRVPQDVAVVGFDDVSIANHLTPPLTTVRAPIEEVGYQATDCLIDLINKKPCEQETLLPTKLVIRQSCGCNNPFQTSTQEVNL